MKQIRHFAARIICVLFVGLSSVSAADRVALVIGAGDYEEAPKLKNATSDARAVAKLVKESLGFELIAAPEGGDIWENASTDDFYQALDLFRARGQTAEVGFFYFAGHGVEVDEENYLLPIDATLEQRSQLRSQAIELQEVLEDMGDAGFRSKIVVLDCCRDNPLTRSWARTRSSSTGLGVVHGSSLPVSTMIMFSAAPGQAALDGEGVNSPFTSAFVEEMGRAGTTTLDAFFKISDRVVEKTNRRQEPWVVFDGSGKAFRSLTLRPGEIATGGGLMQKEEGGSSTASRSVGNSVVKVKGQFTLPEYSAAQREAMQKKFLELNPDVPKDFFERHKESEGPRYFENDLLGVPWFDGGYIATILPAGCIEATSISVSLPASDDFVPAEIVGQDRQTRLVLAKADLRELVMPSFGESLSLSQSTALKYATTDSEGNVVFHDVVLTGVGLKDLNLTNGGIEEFFLTDLDTTEFGSSGGPVVTEDGKLVGLSFMHNDLASENDPGVSAYGIPVHHLESVLNSLKENGKMEWGLLGATLRNLDENYAVALGVEEDAGVLVVEVYPGTPAEAGGLRAGDVVTSLDGESFSEVQLLRHAIARAGPEKQVAFGILRKGTEVNKSVVLANLDKFEIPASGETGSKSVDILADIKVSDLDSEAVEALKLPASLRGIVIESIGGLKTSDETGKLSNEEQNPAAVAGLRPGMVILAIDQQEVASVGEAQRIMEDFSGEVVLLEVYAGGIKDLLAVPVK